MWMRDETGATSLSVASSNPRAKPTCLGGVDSSAGLLGTAPKFRFHEPISGRQRLLEEFRAVERSGCVTSSVNSRSR